MTCPCCGKEMEPGYIKSPQQISWSRNTEMGYEPVGEGKIRLSQNFWNGYLIIISLLILELHQFR